jgi:hypothetical protein
MLVAPRDRYATEGIALDDGADEGKEIMLLGLHLKLGLSYPNFKSIPFCIKIN